MKRLGIVGESGCGKSTLARAIISMVPAETGRVLWFGKDLLALQKTEDEKTPKRNPNDLSRSTCKP